MLSHGRAVRVGMLSLVLAVLAWAQASAQQPVYKLPPTLTPEIEKLLEQGKQLENQRRWGEALTLYEEAAPQEPWPDRARRTARTEPDQLRPCPSLR
jgi:hypothetical protein